MKYNKDFKLKVVKEFKSGKYSYMELAKKYNMPAFSVIKNWVDKYDLNGPKGLEHRKNKHYYSQKFRLKVVNYYLNNNVTLQKTAEKFDIANAATIYVWVDKYNKNDEDGLSDTAKSSKLKK